MAESELIIGQAYVYFAITSDTLTETDFLHWLGMEPDAFGISGVRSDNPRKSWEITTPKTDDPFLYPMIRGIVDRLIPIKDRLVAFKQEYPDLHYVLEVVLYQGDGTAGLSLDNDTLQFLAKIGAMIDCDIYRA
jgi:Domain of unknown function (DUF4279)